MPSQTKEKNQDESIPQQLWLGWGMRDLIKSIFTKKNKGIFKSPEKQGGKDEYLEV